MYINTITVNIWPTQLDEFGKKTIKKVPLKLSIKYHTFPHFLYFIKSIKQKKLNLV